MAITIVNKWILGVVTYVFCMYTFSVFVFDEDFLIYFTPLMLVSALAITTSLIVNLIFHYHGKSQRFSRAYTYLAIGFAAYTIAELLYGLFDIHGMEPYPSLVEPFYMVYFAGSILFCIALWWCRRNLIPKYLLGVSAAVGVICFAAYMLLSMNATAVTAAENADYHLVSNIMMVFSSVLVGAATLTSITLWKAPQLKNVWLVIGVALFLNAIADIFYYSNINYGHFLYSDFSNIIWFGTVLMIFFALYKHRFLYMGEKHGS